MSFHIQRIRPVGNKIETSRDSLGDKPFPDFHTAFYSSGTASLAAAIIATHKLKPDVKQPEIIVPAYGCPDIISAVVFANATPVLVDLEPDSPYLSLDEINNSITKNTIAIIAVRFFGIPERYNELATLAKQNNLTLIEDSAQGFPIIAPSSYWQGDLSIISFGRGKPINLLGGGAVLSHDLNLIELLPKFTPIQATNLDKLKFKLKLFLYNQSIKPFTYGFISQLPGLKIGQTIYKPLHEINGISDFTKSYLNTNVNAYKNRNHIHNEYSNILHGYSEEKLIDLPLRFGHDMSQPLLRYPILVKNQTIRDLIYEQLNNCGASLMYKRPLHQIDKVDKYIKRINQIYPNATRFASQLLTLPTHEAVDDKILQIIQNRLKGI